jgi:putative photosynthetic complex assembly protein
MILSSLSLSRSTTLTMLGTVATVVFLTWVISQSQVSSRYPDAPAKQVKQLRFEDRSDGSIAVFDYQTGKQIDSIVGEAGFVRGALRTLAQERKRRDIDSKPPFELIARQDGRLTLIDPSTGRTIDLESFGAINANNFARLLRVDSQMTQQR